MATVTVQVVLEEELLREADRAAKEAAVNRSELMRRALREHLRRLEIQAKEALDRAGYERQPSTVEEFAEWDEVAAWPDE